MLWFEPILKVVSVKSRGPDFKPNSERTIKSKSVRHRPPVRMRTLGSRSGINAIRRLQREGRIIK